MMSPSPRRFRRFVLTTVAGLSALALASCDRSPGAALPSEPIDSAPVAARPAADPTATWKIPLSAAGLAFRSDGLFGDGTYSLYAHGVCTVSTSFNFSVTGDATIRTSAPKGGKCGRQFTLVYPDLFTETLPSFNNLNVLEGSTFQIPVGTTMQRRLIIAPGSINVPSRCGRLLFGRNGSVGVGTDSLNVTRVDSSTWHVQSQPDTLRRALCENTGAIYQMPVDFVIVSSAPMP